MSQAGIMKITSGILPPVVATSYVTDNGTAVPLANVLIIHGIDSTENNANGIIIKGGVAGTGTQNLVDAVLTNRVQGIVQTSNATPTPIVTFTPTVIGTYAIEARIAAYNTTSTLGAGYSLFGTARFNGTTSTLCGTPDKITNEEGAMSSANVTMTVSGANILINAVGYNTENINWSAVGLYTFIGV
jgi:hypothetical protein